MSVVVDTTPPTIEISRPRDGFAAGTAAVTGRIVDPRLDSWVVELTDTPDLPDWQVIGEGGTLDSDRQHAGGVGTCRKDRMPCGCVRWTRPATIRSGSIPFEVDATEPVVTLDAPAFGAVLGAALGPVAVEGSAVEEHPRLWRLELGTGDDPATWATLAAGGGLPPAGHVFDWGAGGLADGLYTLRLLVEDLGGLIGDSRVPVVIDNTLPTVAITAPAADSWVTGPTTVLGTAWDPNLAQVRVEVAAAGTGAFSELGRSTASVQDGPLLTWQSLPPDGAYRLRLVVEDRAANRAIAELPVRIDTRPPAAPLGLEAELAGDGESATLTWQAGVETDVVGYQVERSGVRITSAPVPSTTFVDPLANDGTFYYTVRAVDRAGQESGPSAAAQVVRDTTPPGVVIHRPLSGDSVSGLVDVRITAASADFHEYRLSVGPADGSEPLVLLRRSPVPARSEVVAQWNASSLPQGVSYRFRLEAEDVRGNVGATEAVVTIDNQPPAAPTGLTATASGANVDLAWAENAETDLAGYLLYRDGLLLHGVGDDLVRRALHEPAYGDLDLPDGTFTYRVAAIDRAGNLSPLSAPATVTIDRRAPHAEIVQPEAGARFDGPAYTVAALVDRDVTGLVFEWRPAGGAWSPFASRSAAPWEATWNPAGLDYGDYELRAVATDAGGQTDPAPTPVPVTYTDLERPAPAKGLAVRGRRRLRPPLLGRGHRAGPGRLFRRPGAGERLAGAGDTGSGDRYRASSTPASRTTTTTTAWCRSTSTATRHWSRRRRRRWSTRRSSSRPWSPTAQRTADLAGRGRPAAAWRSRWSGPTAWRLCRRWRRTQTEDSGSTGSRLAVGVNELAAVATDAGRRPEQAGRGPGDRGRAAERSDRSHGERHRSDDRPELDAQPGARHLRLPGVPGRLSPPPGRRRTAGRGGRVGQRLRTPTRTRRSTAAATPTGRRLSINRSKGSG